MPRESIGYAFGIDNMLNFAIFALLAVSAINALPSKKQHSYLSPMPRAVLKDGATFPTRPDGRIVGGEVASQGQFPYQAAITIDDRYFCGGILIGANVVLSAGHCTTGSNSVEITMGELVQSEASGIEQVRTASGSSIVTHEDYGSFAGIINDVGVITVSSAFDLDDNVATIDLASSGPDAGDVVTVSGWGKTSDSPLAGVADELHYADVTVAEPSVCQGYAKFDTAQHICVSGEDLKGACNGDSGGPLVPSGAQNEVQGIVSYGSSEGCMVGRPVVFTRVSYFVDWINANSG